MKIRPSPLAGRWYPGDPDILVAELDRYLDQVDCQPPPGKIWGVVAPHAGYRYSGPVAAHAFHCLRGLKPDLVVVVSPLHQPHFDAVLTSPYEAYQTPLGQIPVDRAAIEQFNLALRERLDDNVGLLYQDQEHALEIELPFLQHLLGPFRLLPIMLCDQSSYVAKAVGAALARLTPARNALFVASSDLSHFYPEPVANRFDYELLSRLEAFDPEGVILADIEGAGFACGRGAIAAVLWATQALGANRVQILRHATSGDISGDYGSVVGYGAAVIWQAGDEEDSRPKQVT
jgi:hypothetical protein